MNYEYAEAKSFASQPYVYIRLKYERKYYMCEYYDGMRILLDSLPEGKHRYETRHSDNDIAIPIAIAPKSKLITVNFCGTIVSGIPISVSVEKQIMEFLFAGDCRENYAQANCYNPIQHE